MNPQEPFRSSACKSGSNRVSSTAPSDTLPRTPPPRSNFPAAYVNASRFTSGPQLPQMATNASRQTPRTRGNFPAPGHPRRTASHSDTAPSPREGTDRPGRSLPCSWCSLPSLGYMVPSPGARSPGAHGLLPGPESFPGAQQPLPEAQPPSPGAASPPKS